MPNVGVLTGGGDCPGLNPAIRGILRYASTCGWSVIGVRYGWKGLLSRTTQDLPLDSVDDLLYQGGTVLGTSRTNPYKEKDGLERIRESFRALRLDALIAIGGEDTLGVASKLFGEGLPIVGLPKTIDNDILITDFTIGFLTAFEIATDALDRLKTTAQSHERVMVVEIMGRHAGWLTLYAGMAGGADVVLIPEFPMSISDLCAVLDRCQKRGKNYALVAVAEGAKILDENGKEITSQTDEPVDAFGHVQLGGIGDRVREMIEKRTGRDVRTTVLGHTQRGGTPAAFDRMLSTILGVEAMRLVETKQFGKMPAWTRGRIEVVAISDAVARLKTVPRDLYDLAKIFFG